MRQQTARLAALVVLMVLVGACAAPTQSDPGSGAPGSGQAPADEAPSANGPERDFSVTSFSGSEFTLAGERGSPVVLNFFESW